MTLTRVISVITYIYYNLQYRIKQKSSNNYFVQTKIQIIYLGTIDISHTIRKHITGRIHFNQKF